MRMKKLHMFSLLCALLACSFVPQATWAQDSIDTPDFTPDSSDFVFDFESDFSLYKSSGYFPIPYPDASWTVFLQTGGYYSSASNLRSSAFAPTTSAFSCDNPYETDDDEHEIMEAWTNSAEDDIPQAGLWGLGLQGTLQTKFPVMLTGQVALLCSDDVLFSEDKSRAFVSNDGEMLNFKEITLFHISEYIATAGAGLTIPVYGAYVQNDGVFDEFRFSSVYYVHIGASYSVSFGREIQQFAHIATHKNKIRFPNGTDTLRTTLAGVDDSVRSTSLNVECALGWKLTISDFIFGLELYATIPTEYALKDAAWRRTIGGMRFNLGF